MTRAEWGWLLRHPFTTLVMLATRWLLKRGT